MNLYIMCLTHSVDHQHAAVAVSTVFSVTYKNIRHADNMSKRIMETLEITKVS